MRVAAERHPVDVPTPLPCILLESEHLRVAVYPALGGKLASILWLADGQELLQQPLLPAAARTRTMSFEQGDASGYDDCIPSVSACEIDTQAGPVFVPDHGDFWRLGFNVLEANAGRVSMSAAGFSLPLRLEKTISLRSGCITLAYRLTNEGSAPLQYLWSAHPSFSVEAGDRIDLPSSVESVTVEASGGSRLGAEGTTHRWPLTHTCPGHAIDLSLVEDADSRVADKIFAPAPQEGWCAIRRIRTGRRIEMRFDPAQAPYMGIWMSYRGWPAGKAAQQYCVALEPCTAPADSLAKAIEQGTGRRLASKATDEWQVDVHIT
ncbi:MAG TPA: hypothetical protein VGD59_15225 [Acidisarcina sp.]